MRTTWHIVRKDTRRLALPVAVWLAFQAGALTWFAQAPGFLANDPGTWLYGFGLWSELIHYAQLLFGFVLVGVLVLEDPVRGSDVFWRTRPIAGTRLLAAKSLTAAMLVVIAPVIVLTPVWLGLGFSGRELIGAAWFIVRAYFGAALLGLAGGSLAATLAQHLGAGFGLVAAAVVSLAAGTWVGARYSLRLRWDDPGDPILGGLQAAALVVLAVVPVVQYMTRRTAVTGLLISVMMASMFLLGHGLTSGSVLAVPAVATSAAGNAESGRADMVIVERIRGRLDTPIPKWGERNLRVPTLELALRQTSAVDEFLLPVGGTGELWWSGENRVHLYLERGGTVSPEQVRAIAGETRGATETQWSLRLRRQGDPVQSLEAGPASLKGLLQLEVLRGRVMGVMPVREGAMLYAGSNRVRIAAVQRSDRAEQRDRLVIEEREAAERDGHVRRMEFSFARRASKLDFYLLRAAGDLHLLGMEENGGVGLSAVAIGVRRLTLPSLPWPDIEGGTLYKVRFERVGRRFQEVQASEIEVEGDSQP